MGPIEQTPDNQEKLKALYATVNNPRVRWVIGATLRRPWEDVYPGDQRNALAFDKDLVGILMEEYLRARVTNVLQTENRPLKLQDLAGTIQEEPQRVMESLHEMVAEGLVGRLHMGGIAHFVMHA